MKKIIKAMLFAIFLLGTPLCIFAQSDEQKLMLAIRNNESEIAVQLLQTENIDVNYQGASGITPLMSASFKGNVNIVKLLLAKGAKPNLAAYNGAVPLSYAFVIDDKCAKPEIYADIVELLLKAGANPNYLQDYEDDGMLLSSLLRADAASGERASTAAAYKKIAILLIEYGAEKNEAVKRFCKEPSIVYAGREICDKYLRD